MVKILYVIPPYFDIKDNDPKTVLPVFTIPYGILSIDAYIKKNVENVETQLLDFNVEIKKTGEYNINTLKDKVFKFQPDLIAISALFNTSYKHLDRISRMVRYASNRIPKNVKIIAGGGLPTNLYEKILKECIDIDSICYGEGEIPIVEFLHSGMSVNFEHQSWITRKSLEEEQKPLHTFVHNLDDIPSFDYSLINLGDYNNRSLDKDCYNRKKVEMSIHTSRGCPFDCVFCANGKLHGKKVRYMSVEKVIHEVDNMVDYGMTTLMVEDDHFLSDKERAKEILIRLSHYQITIEFPNGLAVYAIDEEIGKLLKEADCSVVALAIESGSDYVLKEIINKPLKVSMIKPAVEILRKNDIQIHAFIVIGLPRETHLHRIETLNMLKDVGFDWVHFFIAIPIVGSRLYDICIKNGYLIDNNMNNHIISKANIKTSDIDPLEIEKEAYLMNLDVNFVNNHNMKVRNCERAMLFFENVVKKYTNHAFAHYYLAESQFFTHKPIDSYENRKIFFDIINKDKNWLDYTRHFKLISWC